ncbi:MAG TPA: hypothetical protein VNE63_07650 [Candidatus Acidoferrales bacterium]|nr:hypothetical protein [Candidatus Acidoferrales bacterium]
MPLEIYRRHNPAKCNSRDTVRCKDKRRPCPIWVRGSTNNGRYIRQPLKTRDWIKADDLRRELEATGELPKIPIEDTRTTITTWQEKFIQNMKAENLCEDTIRKYNLVFKQIIAFANDRGIRFIAELDLPSIQDFRKT